MCSVVASLPTFHHWAFLSARPQGLAHPQGAKRLAERLGKRPSGSCPDNLGKETPPPPSLQS